MVAVLFDHVYKRFLLRYDRPRSIREAAVNWMRGQWHGPEQELWALRDLSFGGQEIGVWRYQIHFDDPGAPTLESAPSTDIELINMQAYYEWLDHHAELSQLRRERDELREERDGLRGERDQLRDVLRGSEQQGVGLSPEGSNQSLPASTWSSHCRTAWSVLRFDGLLALLRKAQRFVYWRFIHRWKGS